MWSDEMERRIREAAENDIQNYQENDWKNMEVLLDKHLPKSKRRRGIIVFFLLAALTVSGYLLVSSVSSSRRTVAQEEEVTVTETGNSTNDNSTKAADKTLPAKEEPSKVDSKTVQQLNDKIISDQQRDNSSVPASSGNTAAIERKNNDIPANIITPGLINRNKVQDIQSIAASRTKNNRNSRPSNPQQGITNDLVAADKVISPAITDKKDNDIKNVTPATDNKQSSAPESKTFTQNDKQSTQPAVAENKEAKSEPVAAVENKPAKKERNIKSFANRLSLTASAGPDYSSVKLSQRGEVRLNYGIGVSYEINDRFTIRTGFYAGSKVYSTDAKSYHTPYINGPYSYKLTSVDADCYVYEVPVNLVYNFKSSNKHNNWFASAGLSSYFMNKEDYLYTYTNSSGQKYSHLWQFRNENKHPFSVLGVSAGYRHSFNDRFSLLAEPYFKAPIGGGVGDGRVRLNSAGVLFTGAWKPFAKK